MACFVLFFLVGMFMDVLYCFSHFSALPRLSSALVMNCMGGLNEADDPASTDLDGVLVSSHAVG